MPFDGICVAAVVDELNRNLTGGRIVKIAQPEKEEILLQIKTERDTARLFINVSAGMPFLYLTNENKPSPMTAPNFCMVLRKHLQGGRILSVTQPGLERVVEITVGHLDEMGDLCKRTLVFELIPMEGSMETISTYTLFPTLDKDEYADSEEADVVELEAGFVVATGLFVVFGVLVALGTVPVVDLFTVLMPNNGRKSKSLKVFL